MKLCQENTELAEKLKSIIDQYELREEVSSALAAGWDGSTLSGCPRGSGSTAGSLAIIRLSLRVAPAVLCPQSSAVPAARSLRCGTAWDSAPPVEPRQPCCEAAGLRHPSSQRRQLSAELPQPRHSSPRPLGTSPSIPFLLPAKLPLGTSQLPFL